MKSLHLLLMTTFLLCSCASGGDKERKTEPKPAESSFLVKDLNTNSPHSDQYVKLETNMGDVTIPVTNIFYVSQYQNISTEDATEYVKVERCDGYKTDVTVHKLSANNKFYITYSKNDLWSPDGNLNDREAQSFGKSSAGKFNDGLYGR